MDLHNGSFWKKNIYSIGKIPAVLNIARIMNHAFCLCFPANHNAITFHTPDQSINKYIIVNAITDVSNGKPKRPSILPPHLIFNLRVI